MISGIIGVAAGWFGRCDPNCLGCIVSVLPLYLCSASRVSSWASLSHRAIPGAVGVPGIMGGISIIVGILLLCKHMAAATLVLPWVIGIFAIVGGIFAIIMAFRLVGYVQPFPKLAEGVRTCAVLHPPFFLLWAPLSELRTIDVPNTGVSIVLPP